MKVLDVHGLTTESTIHCRRGSTCQRRRYCCLRFLFHHLLITPGAIHHVTKEKVREATALPKLEDVIRCRRLRWLGRLSGMDRRRFPRQALTWEPAGFRRRPGRPRRNWKDIVKKALRKMGISLDEVEEAAEDWRRWRNRVAQYVFDTERTRNSRSGCVPHRGLREEPLVDCLCIGILFFFFPHILVLSVHN